VELPHGERHILKIVDNKKIFLKNDADSEKSITFAAQTEKEIWMQ